MRRVLIGVGAFALGFVVIVFAGRVLIPATTPTRFVVPYGQYLQGLVVGLLSALLAIGLVLVYRANRIINFAQGELGAFAATLAQELYQRAGWPFVPSVLIGILGAVLSSLFVEFAVIRRFSKAPRLILTVATIGVAQILGAIELTIPAVFNRGADVSFTTQLTSPLSTTFGCCFEKARLVIFRGDHIVVLIVAPLILIGLTLFFRFSRYGVAARAAAENEDRARLLGVRVKRVSLIVWGMAGFMSAVAAILRAPILGFQFGSIGGPSLLLRGLAAAVIGRMENLTVTALAAILLTMGEQTIFITYGKSGPTDGFFMVVIVVALFLQRKRLGRVDPASSTWRAVQEVRQIPRELRALPEIRMPRIGIGAFVLAVFLLMPIVLPAKHANLMSVLHIYGIVGISLVLLTGWSGNVSLGQWAFVGVGGLIAQRLATQEAPLDFFLIVLISAFCGAAVALAIGVPALRIRGLFLGVTTLAFAIAAGSWFFQFEQLQYRGSVVRPKIFGLFDVTSERAYYYVTLAGVVFALWVGRNVRRSRLGRVLIALRDNEVQAQAIGVRPTRAKLTAFALSGFLAAFGGALYAYNQQALRYDRFPAADSIIIFSMVVIGGMGSMSGALLGAAYVKFIQYFLPAQFQLYATGFGLLILLLVFPGGLGQILYGVRDRWLRRVADKRGILVPSLIADRREPETLAGAAPPDETPEPAPVPAPAGVRR